MSYGISEQEQSRAMNYGRALGHLDTVIGAMSEDDETGMVTVVLSRESAERIRAFTSGRAI